MSPFIVFCAALTFAILVLTYASFHEHVTINQYPEDKCILF